ncbi:hypothetical protein [Clostridium sp.]|nr:hypothetical protein [Clostridium sp.]
MVLYQFEAARENLIRSINPTTDKKAPTKCSEYAIHAHSIWSSCTT